MVGDSRYQLIRLGIGGLFFRLAHAQQLKDFLQTSTNLTFFWEKIIDRFFLSNDVTHHHTGGILIFSFFV